MQKTSPRYLFRAWSNQSNGTNTTTRFEPASHASQPGSELKTPPTDLSSQLKLALIGKEFANVPFVFFTSSLLFALVCAGFKKEKAEGQIDIQITCIDTKTATTASGDAVEFRLVSDLVEELGVQIKHGYADEYVAMSSVIAGSGSCTASLDSLIASGLYKLYPELDKVNDRKPSWYSALRQLREFGFKEDRSLTKDKIGVAAMLAFCFKSSYTAISQETHRDATGQLTAHLLAIQRRKRNDKILLVWLGHSEVPMMASERDNDKEASHESPEVKQYRGLTKLLATMDLDRCKRMLATSPAIDPADVTRAIAEWEQWAKQNREERRAARGVDRRRSDRNDRYERPSRHRRFDKTATPDGYERRKTRGKRARLLERRS